MESFKNIKGIFVNAVIKHLQNYENIKDKEKIKSYVESLKEIMVESLTTGE